MCKKTHNEAIVMKTHFLLPKKGPVLFSSSFEVALLGIVLNRIG